PHRLELRLRHAVAAGEQCHLVAERHELVGEISHHALAAAVEFWRHGLHEGCDLGNLHMESLPTTGVAAIEQGDALWCRWFPCGPQRRLRQPTAEREANWLRRMNACHIAPAVEPATRRHAEALIEG